MQLRGDLRVPLERHDQGADLVVFPVADLLEGEGLRPQAVHLRPDRVDRLAEVRGVHARRDRPHPSGRARVEARERVVRQALLVPQVPAEAAVQPDPAEEEVREVQGVVVRVASGDAGRADRDVDLGLVRHRDRLGPGTMGRRGRDRRRSAPLSPQTRQPGGDRVRPAGAPPLEGEELLPVVELGGRADPLEAVRELRGAHPAGAAQEELGRELGDAVVGPLRRDAGRHAPAERDERVRRQGVRDEDGAVPDDGPVREVHAGTSWAWNRTTVRCSSTRYVRATARTWSARTFSTFARSVSPNSQEPRPSPAPRRIPWNVTPSCSYRAQARTCWRARASSDFGGGLFWIFSISRSRTASTRSRVAPRAKVTLAINSAGSSFISCLTPTSVARRASTSARYRRFERGRQSPAANGTMPRQPPRTVDRRTSAAVSSCFAEGMCHPADRRSAGPGRSRSLRRSPCCSGSERRSGSGGVSGFRGANASRTRCIATAGSKPPTRIREAVFGA